jgi:hypothetical protein
LQWLQDVKQVSGRKLKNVKVKLTDILGGKEGEYLKDKFNQLAKE